MAKHNTTTQTTPMATTHFSSMMYEKRVYVVFVRLQWNTFCIFHVYVFGCVVWRWIRIYIIYTVFVSFSFYIFVRAWLLCQANTLTHSLTYSFTQSVLVRFVDFLLVKITEKKRHKKTLSWKLRVCRFPCIILIGWALPIYVFSSHIIKLRPKLCTYYYTYVHKHTQKQQHTSARAHASLRSTQFYYFMCRFCVSANHFIHSLLSFYCMFNLSVFLVAFAIFSLFDFVLC